VIHVSELQQPAAPAGVHARRVIFIDLARALATVFMLYGHTVAALLAPRYQVGQWFAIWVFQRGLTSCLFLLLSGFAFSIATSKHWSVHGRLSPEFFRRTRRFALFIVLGYALHFPVQRLIDLRTAPDDRWQSFLAVDVLQLIGVTFLFVQLVLLVMRTRIRFAMTLLGLAALAVLSTPWMWSRDYSGLPMWMAAYLSPASGSQFPLFPWIAFILTGAALGQLYAAWGAAQVSRYANLALVVPGATLVVLAVSIKTLVGDAAWESVPTQMGLRMGASLMVLGVIAQASRWVTRLPHAFGAVAQETLLIYFVHLCIVYGSIWNSGLAQSFGPTLTPVETLGFVLILFAAMVTLASFWNRWKHVRPRSARWVSIGAGGLLLYRLF
jgi:acyltransferase